MKFFVLGVDGPAFGSVEHLSEAHWAYMDRWADHLVARGPTTSVDGHHTGSVHVVDLPSLAAAFRFAHEEPFAKVGWYSAVTVTPVIPCLDGNMWDRPAAGPGQASSLVLASFEKHSSTAVGLASLIRESLDATDPPPWIFCGVTEGDARNAVGFVTLADDSPATAQSEVLALLQAVGVTMAGIRSQHWRRGGRPA